jgi:hypothetical protein
VHPSSPPSHLLQRQQAELPAVLCWRLLQHRPLAAKGLQEVEPAAAAAPAPLRTEGSKASCARQGPARHRRDALRGPCAACTHLPCTSWNLDTRARRSCSTRSRVCRRPLSAKKRQVASCSLSTTTRPATSSRSSTSWCVQRSRWRKICGSAQQWEGTATTEVAQLLDEQAARRKDAARQQRALLPSRSQRA